MNKLPIHTPPTSAARLSLAHRPALPMDLADMQARSRHLAQEPALRMQVVQEMLAGHGPAMTKAGPDAPAAVVNAAIAIAVKSSTSTNASVRMYTRIAISTEVNVATTALLWALGSRSAAAEVQDRLVAAPPHLL